MCVCLPLSMCPDTYVRHIYISQRPATKIQALSHSNRRPGYPLPQNFFISSDCENLTVILVVTGSSDPRTPAHLQPGNSITVARILAGCVLSYFCWLSGYNWPEYNFLLQLLEFHFYFAVNDVEKIVQYNLRNSTLSTVYPHPVIDQQDAVVDCKHCPRCRQLANSTKHTRRFSFLSICYVKTWRHPQNQKYITYRNAVREWSSHGHR